MIRHDTFLNDRGHFSLLALFCVALSIPIIVGQGGLSSSQMMGIAFIVVFSAILGRLIIRTWYIESVWLPSWLLQLMTGYLVLSLLILLFIRILNVDVIIAGSLSAGLCIIATMVMIIFRPTHHKKIQEFGSTKTKNLWFDLSVVALISTLVSIWSREALRSVSVAEVTGVFRAWSDFFLHSAELKYLLDYSSFSGESMYLSDVPQVFYHRGSYAVSSLFSYLSNTPVIDSTMYYWMPTGMIFLGIGVYIFGCALGGRWAGLLSVAILYFTPDPAMYVKHNALFSFHWLIQVAPGTGYALGAALSGFSLYVCGLRESQFRLIAAGAVFIIASTIFRMQIGLLAGLSYVVLMFFSWRPEKLWYKMAVFVGGLGVIVLMVFFLEKIPLAPHLITGKRDGLQYISIIFGVLPAGNTGLRQAWTLMSNGFLKGLLGYMAILPLELGFFLPLLLVVLPLVRRKQVEPKLWSMPVLLILSHYVLTLYMPTPIHGDISEWSHRSFPLLYSVVVVFSISLVCRMFSGKIVSEFGNKLGPVSIVSIFLAVASLFFLPWYFGKNIQEGFIGEGKSATSTQISPEIFTVARFIREKSSPGDLFVSSGGDPLAIMVALTERQAYLSREPFFEKVGGKTADIVRARISKINAISTFEKLVSFGSINKVRWFVLFKEDNPKLFDESSAYSALTVNEVCIFDLTN